MENTFESSRVLLSAVVVRGTSSGNKAMFSVMKDGTEFAKQEVTLRGDKAEYVVEKLPEVAPDKEFWTLTYKVTVDGQPYEGPTVYKVWPLKVSLKAVNETNVATPGVPFTIVQNGEERVCRSGPSGSVVHWFRWPAPFQVLIKKEFWLMGWNSTAQRKWEAKVDTKLDPQFENPPQASDERHFVNLATTNDGADGKGHTIKCVCFSKGAEGGRGGKVGDKVWVHVKFERTSVRTTPVQAVQGLTALQVVVAGKEFKGYVPIAADGGTAEFTLELGLGGGDKCTVKISGQPGGDGPEHKFVNWRKLYYEILAPDWMGLEDNGGKMDMPAGARTALKNRADPAFFVYELHASQTFTAAEAPAGTIYDGAYFGGTAGTNFYLLTDHTFTLYPKGINKGAGPKRVILKLCRYNYFWDSQCALEDIEDTTEAVDIELTMTQGAFFKKSCEEAGGSSLRALSWAPVIAVATYFTFPDLDIPAGYTAPPGKAEDYAGKVTVRETNQDKSCELTFGRSMGIVGNFTEEVASTEMVKLQALLKQCCADIAGIKAANGRLTFEIIGPSGNERRTKRLANVKKAIQTAFDANKKKVSKHPAIKDDGTVHAGPLTEAAITEVTMGKFKVTLPATTTTEPGSLVGALSATKCPIKVTARVEAAGAGLGLAGRGAQEGENLVFYNPDAVDSSVDVALHELSHSLGLTLPGAWPPGVTARPRSYRYDASTDTYSAGTADGIYDGHGHSGWHCAHGVPGSRLGRRTYSGGKCVMFGENDGSGPTLATAGFCPKCKEHLLAADL